MELDNYFYGDLPKFTNITSQLIFKEAEKTLQKTAAIFR